MEGIGLDYLETGVTDMHSGDLPSIGEVGCFLLQELALIYNHQQFGQAQNAV